MIKQELSVGHPQKYITSGLETGNDSEVQITVIYTFNLIFFETGYWYVARVGLEHVVVPLP